MTTHLFVLSPPFSGSTVLWRLLQTSSAVSALADEGQHLPGVREHLRDHPWEQRPRPWGEIREIWNRSWDPSKSIFLEKSPPNLLHALDIQEAFADACFIGMVRDPYAFCEGYRRRTGKSPEASAAFWVRLATIQLRNYATLDRVIHFTYEEFTRTPGLVAARLEKFLPALGALDPAASFSVHSVLGGDPRSIRNLNPLKIDRLTNRDIVEISGVLEESRDVLAAFGYELLQPSWRQTLRYGRGLATKQWVAAKKLAKGVSRRLRGS